MPLDWKKLLALSCAFLLSLMPACLNTSSIVISRRPLVSPAALRDLRITLGISPSAPVMRFVKPSICERWVRPRFAISIAACFMLPISELSLRRTVPYWSSIPPTTWFSSSLRLLAITSWRTISLYSGVPFWISGVSSIGATCA